MRRLNGKIILISSLLLVNSYCQELHSYSASITRNGFTKLMTIYDFWSREYPKPVIYIKPNKSGYIRIKGYPSPRKLTKKTPCLIKTGLYHPWSEDNTSVKVFYTITPKVSYIALKNINLDDGKIKIDKGDILENEAYISEGECYYILNKIKGITTYCIGEDNKEFKKIKERSFPTQQWLYLQCKEGYNIFIQDKELLKYPQVTKGVIKDYGKVAPE